MTTVRYENPEGYAVSFGEGALKLIKTSGLEAPETALSVAKGASTDGSASVFARPEPRIVTVEAALCTEGLDEASIGSAKTVIARALAAHDTPGTLIVRRYGRERVTEAYPSRACDFGKKAWNQPWQTVRAEFLCPSPWFRDAEAQRVEIKFYARKTEFAEEGIEIGEEGIELSAILHTGARTVEIENEGDVAAPVRIGFTGPLVNPVVRNMTTGEMVRIAKTITEDEYVELYTEPGARRILLHENGHEMNGMHCLDLASRFWRLRPGKNIVEFGDESPGEGSEAFVEFARIYLGA